MLAVKSTEKLSSEDELRASYYALLSRLLIQSPDTETLTLLRDMGSDDSPFGTALGTMRKIAEQTSVEQTGEEFTKLFYGHGAGGEISPYESLYITGLIYDKPLAQLRNDLAEFGLEHARHNDEPEDHAGYILEIMHGLIIGTYGKDITPERQFEFFQSHIAPWMEKFFEDLEKADSSYLYSAIGTIGRLFIVIESDYFKMAA